MKTRHDIWPRSSTGPLSAMDRFYNQYILVPEGMYVVGSNGSSAKELLKNRIPVDAFLHGTVSDNERPLRGVR